MRHDGYSTNSGLFRMNRHDFEEMLIRHEGMKLAPYRDSTGHLTIGVGRNLDDVGISEHEALYLLRNDIARIEEALRETFAVVEYLDVVRYYVVLNMAFNLGVTGLKGFKRMWKALAKRDFLEASVEMIDSKWATQVGSRADELAHMMLTGTANFVDIGR